MYRRRVPSVFTSGFSLIQFFDVAGPHVTHLDVLAQVGKELVDAGLAEPEAFRVVVLLDVSSHASATSPKVGLLATGSAMSCLTCRKRNCFSASVLSVPRRWNLPSIVVVNWPRNGVQLSFGLRPAGMAGSKRILCAFLCVSIVS